MEKEKFGKFISNRRKEKGLTQKELASIIHISDKAISKWERGLSLPDIEMLEVLAVSLDVTIVELLKGERQETKEEQTEKLVLDTIQISKEEKKRWKKKRFLYWIILIIVLILVIWFWLYITTPKLSLDLKYTQEYIPHISNIKGEVNSEYFLSISPDFAIGANKYGYAVFKDPEKAFKTLKKKYKRGIKLIEKEFKKDYCKTSLSKRNFICYGNLGWQVTARTKEEIEEARFVSSFIDIYKSSFSQDTLYKMLQGSLFY